MCGRYCLALRPSQIRQMLQDDDLPVDDAPEDDGEDAPRQSFNFAPSYHGIVYRADVPDRGAGPSVSKKKSNAASDELPTEMSKATGDVDDGDGKPRFKLQSMKWGLIPSWTKRTPNYASTFKTINCRDDSLAAAGGMWASMKARKRCIVLAQGFYEWLKPGGPASNVKIPHFVKRKDGRLMCFAGLWDCAQFENDGGSKHYTYTIITTDSNNQLKFLHDRMPVIFDPDSESLKTWLDPQRHEWTGELQALLKPYAGELVVYPVSSEVGKVGNNSPSFIIPVASKENKNNIANFFSKGPAVEKENKVKPEVEVKEEKSTSPTGGHTQTKSLEEIQETADDGGMGLQTPARGIKREASSSPAQSGPLVKKLAPSASPAKEKQPQQARAKISATRNSVKKSPAKSKGKADGSQKITKFFANSA
ncbi:hypothetical protein B0T26DRAFT_404372 [Lasiosphaeria miniovina]|uniref:DUF159 domain protein n=1 Tax=Lasiosphaeria miniovina TaxID=1954250 RepID=A0AA40DMQ7_9PEZI|nr:uncharacterized protein B0T26DRAFT_404372 [Lasiosphaeria miniovina]KAK0709399.1 hypothetical protein B0T26DRAFT_404372 [Lasiosphaeria miniovina]